LIDSPLFNLIHAVLALETL